MLYYALDTMSFAGSLRWCYLPNLERVMTEEEKQLICLLLAAYAGVIYLLWSES